jgi:steroid delta-isomerase-like uncharacterized protein
MTNPSIVEGEMASTHLRAAALGVLLGMICIAPVQAQSEAEKIRLIQNEAAGWSRNMDLLLASFADDVVYEDPGLGLVLHGKDQIRGFAQSYFDAFPDLKAVIVSTVVSGNRAASEWRFSGTQTGDLPGIPAANKQMDVRGASIYEFEGGKIKHKVDYLDFATVQRQLSAAPAKH